MIVLGNGGHRSFSPHVCLFDLVKEEAERTPQALAVIEPGKQITYGQLVRVPMAWGSNLGS